MLQSHVRALVHIDNGDVRYKAQGSETIHTTSLTSQTALENGVLDNTENL